MRRFGSHDWVEKYFLGSLFPRVVRCDRNAPKDKTQTRPRCTKEFCSYGTCSSVIPRSCGGCGHCGGGSDSGGGGGGGDDDGGSGDRGGSFCFSSRSSSVCFTSALFLFCPFFSVGPPVVTKAQLLNVFGSFATVATAVPTAK